MSMTRELRTEFKKFLDRPLADKRKALYLLNEGMEKKQIKPQDFHLAECFQDTTPNGRRIWESAIEGHAGTLMEGAGPTDTAAFKYLVSGMFQQVFLQAWENPRFIASRLANMSQSTLQPRGRRIPAATRIGSGQVKEGISELEQYPIAAPAEVSILTPGIKKFGFITEASREMLKADPSGGQVMNAMMQGADAEAYKFEKYVLNHALGVTNSYVADFAGADTNYNTYGTLPNTISNIVTSNPLGTPDAIQNVKNRGYTMTNPVTGDLMDSGEIKQVLVPHQLEVVANHYATVGNVERVLLPTDGTTYSYRSFSNNPYPKGYEILTSPLVYNITSSATNWFAGDFQRDLYFVNFWEKEVVTRGMEAEAAFYRDVFFAVKVSRAGVCEWRDLVHVFKSTP